MVEKANDLRASEDLKQKNVVSKQKLRANVREVCEETSDCNESDGEILARNDEIKIIARMWERVRFKRENKTREREKERNKILLPSGLESQPMGIIKKRK